MAGVLRRQDYTSKIFFENVKMEVFEQLPIVTLIGALHETLVLSFFLGVEKFEESMLSNTGHHLGSGS